jgi:hypothetical protein
MSCLLCKSSNEAEVGTELLFHFPGEQGLEKPGILLYPSVLVCLHCGFSRFTTPLLEKVLLAKRSAAAPGKRGNPIPLSRTPTGSFFRGSDKT